MGKRIFQYPEVTELAEDDYIMIDSETDDTRCILASKIAPTLMSKTVTERKVYTASEDGVKGYSSVSVEVPFTNVTDVEGDIVSFDDGEDLPLAGLKTTIIPIQSGSGTPSPTNVRPISGYTEVDVSVVGKNIATTEIYKNHYVLGEDGAENYAGGFIITKTIKIDSSKSYYLSMIGEQTSSYDAIRVGFYDKFLNFINRTNISTPSPITIPNNAEYVRLSYRNIDPYFKDIQLELGSTATTYEPYNGQTYTIPFTDSQGNPIEVFGGECDVVNGEGTETFVKKPIADLSMSKYGTYDAGIRLITSFFDSIDNTLLRQSLSNTFKIEQTGNFPSSGCAIVFGSGGSKTSILIDSTESGLTTDSTVDQIKEWLRSIDAYMVYKQGTPTTFYTQPTSIKSLVGVNNVWADCGKSLVSYQKTWIQPDFTPDNN